MKNTVLRLIIASMAFMFFAWGSTVYYMKYIHDVGGTYWWLGVYGLPAVLLVVWCVDFYLRKTNWFSGKLGTLALVDSLKDTRLKLANRRIKVAPLGRSWVAPLGRSSTVPK